MSTGSPPAPEVASISTSASAVPGGRTTGTITPVEVSLCAQRPHRRRPRVAAPSSAGSGASPGSALIHDRVVQERRLLARPARTSRRTRRRPGAASGARPARKPRRPRRPSHRRCRARPHSRRAREQLAQARADLPDERLHRLLAVGGTHQRGALPASRASACGRTFEGPQPKRPSAGLSSVGIVSCVCSAAGLGVMGFLVSASRVADLEVPRRAAVLPRRSPVVHSTRAPVATVQRV